MPERKKHLWIGVAIFGFALLLRLIGIGWGLKNDLHNQTYHPDEDVVFSYGQDIEPSKFDFTPGFYNYGTLYLTLTRIAGDMTAAYTGAPDPKSDDSYWSYVSRAHMGGRIISALAGAATALVLFLIGLRFFGLFGGIASGLAIAVSSGHAVHSRFQTVDILATFLLALSALFALYLLRPSDTEESSDLPPPTSDLKWALQSGVFAGLSAGTKYTGILALLTLFVAIWFAKKKVDKQSLKLAGAGTLAAIVVFLVTTPGAILESDIFVKNFVYEMQHTSEGHGLVFAGTSPGFIYHLGNIFIGMGILIGLIGIGGLVYAAVKKAWWALALLAFFVPYYVLIGKAEVKFLRYTFPLYVGVAAGFGYAISRSQKGNWKKTGVAFAILSLGGIDSGGLLAAAKSTTWMATEDPRDAAARFVKEDAAKLPNSKVGYMMDPWYWSVPFFKDATIPRKPMGAKYLALIGRFGHPLLARMAMMQGANAPIPTYFYEPIPAELGGAAVGPIDPSTVYYGNFDTRLITEIKPEYLTLTSLEAGYMDRLKTVPNLSKGTQAEVDKYFTFMNLVKEQYVPMQSFGAPAPTVEDMLYIQPTVLIWKRKGL